MVTGCSVSSELKIATADPNNPVFRVNVLPVIVTGLEPATTSAGNTKNVTDWGVSISPGNGFALLLLNVVPLTSTEPPGPETESTMPPVASLLVTVESRIIRWLVPPSLGLSPQYGFPDQITDIPGTTHVVETRHA